MIQMNEKDLNLIEEKYKKLCQIHSLTKKYIIQAEEYSLEMQTYIQPMKEQKDAYEHLIRAYTKMYDVKDIASNLDEGANVVTSKNTENELDEEPIAKYVLSNLDKAIGHEFRAFYDTMDYLTIIIRDIIFKELKDYKFTDIVQVYPNYKNVKKQLLGFPDMIARERNNKDIEVGDALINAKNYAQIIDKLLVEYKLIVDNILSKIHPF